MKKSRNNHDSSRPPSRPPQRNSSSYRETTRRDPAGRAYHDYESSYDRYSSNTSSGGNRYRDSYNDRYNDRYSDRYSDRYNERYDDDRRREPYRQNPPRRSSGGGSSSNRPRKSQTKRRRPFPISTVILLLVVVVLLVLLMKSCISDSLGSGKYKLELESQMLTVGSTTQAKISGIPEGEEVSIQYTSSSDDIASVDDSGKVEAHKVGDVSLTAIINGKISTNSVSLSVREVDSSVTSITMQDSLTLPVGQTTELKPNIVSDNNDEPPLIVWKSSDPTIASVNSNGIVTAHSVGVTAIQATVGNQTRVCMVNVTEATEPDPNADPNADPNVDPNADPADPNAAAPNNGDTGDTQGGTADPNNTATPTSLVLNEQTATLSVGSTRTLVAAILPEEASSLTVTWSSSDDSIATVSKGVVLARAAGTVTITAKVGSLEKTCTITVTE